MIFVYILNRFLGATLGDTGLTTYMVCMDALVIASIIDIGGGRYKILLMCRVNPYKIRQPQGFPDCWILNPTPSEVRPYRILIKKIFQSPMAGASQNEIKTFDSNPDYNLFGLLWVKP